VLIAALALLRDQGGAFDCEIAGDGDERARLEGLIARHGLGDRVRLVGWRDDVPAFLAAGDVFAFPSHQEGFPLVLLEAMAVGLPVVSSAIPGPMEMIEDGIDGALVPPGDPAALARPGPGRPGRDAGKVRRPGPGRPRQGAGRIRPGQPEAASGRGARSDARTGLKPPPLCAYKPASASCGWVAQMVRAVDS
jgi:hypothetical protein